MAAAELDLWLGDELVARTSSQRDGKVRITYTDEVAEKYEGGTALLSCSLPTPGRGEPAKAFAFLEGLLPEGRALQAAAATVRGVKLREGTLTLDSPTDALLLLSAYGRECAGAVIAVPSGSGAPHLGRYESVDGTRLGEIIRDLPHRPLGADLDREIRLSLAGAQPKFLLARFDGQWFEPVDGAASTHILKPSIDWESSAENEALVLNLARAVGLTASESWVEHYGKQSILATSRYDREVEGRTVRRVHQEDMCQALGMRTGDKYAIGRPSERMARVLRNWADDPTTETGRLFRQIAFRCAVGDEDGHGKNYSLLLDDGRVRLAPLYDSLCTLIYPELTRRMAAQIGNQVSLDKVDRAALLAEAKAMGIPQGVAEHALSELTADLRQALGALDNAFLAGWDSGQVLDTITSRLDRLDSGNPLGGTD
ncbi:MAG: HipA domain-containing protein [Actinomycetota bacterium]|nr:HipA domain-containing protein [Actinomycetota bacterium]MDQ2955434.1 HipA domain-containing protein [Actinomycetota bacterium]